MAENIDTAKFIDGIKKRPALWDTRVLEYSNKLRRQQGWKEICQELFDNYSDLTPSKQKEIYHDLLKKWKGIRSSFTRELQKRMSAPAGHRRQYVYYHKLSFLKPVASNKRFTNDDDYADDSNQENSPVTESVSEQPAFSKSSGPPNPKKQKIDTSSEDNLYEILAQYLTKRNDETGDDDRKFLTSLTPELAKVPDDLKLDCKMELLSLIRNYQNMQMDDENLDDKELLASPSCSSDQKYDSNMIKSSPKSIKSSPISEASFDMTSDHSNVYVPRVSDNSQDSS